MPRAKKQHLKRRADGRYACRYKDHFFYGSTEDEALAQRAAYIYAINNQEIIPSKMTLKAYTEQWGRVAFVGAAESTIIVYLRHLGKIVSFFGEKKLSEIVPLDIKTFYSQCYVGVHNNYIRNARMILVRLLDSAVADGLIKTNPAREKSAAPHKGRTTTSHRSVTKQERAWIESLCTDHRCHPVAMLMLYAGLRPQEAKALNIDEDVDFDAGVIHVRSFAHQVGYTKYVVTSLGKTPKATRTVPLLAPLREALTGHHGLVISKGDGSLVTKGTFSEAWEAYCNDMSAAINGIPGGRRWYGKTKEHKALLAAGQELPPYYEFKVTPYDLRHSFCTMCRDNGVEMHTCIEWMGHTDSSMILRVYDAVTPERTAREAERLNTILSNRSQNGSQPKNTGA